MVRNLVLRGLFAFPDYRKIHFGKTVQNQMRVKNKQNIPAPEPDPIPDLSSPDSSSREAGSVPDESSPEADSISDNSYEIKLVMVIALSGVQFV